MSLQPRPRQRLSPTTAFHESGNPLAACGTVADFWRWAFSDLQQNNVRGVLAEYLVAKALGVVLGVRESWADFDHTTPEGVKVEVKASGYLQSWAQKSKSAITFTGLSGRSWAAAKGYSEAPSFRADVFVFCVQTCDSHDAYDCLDVRQWEFRVIPRTVLEKRGYSSIGLAEVRSLCPDAVDFSDLRARVLAVASTATTGTS